MNVNESPSISKEKEKDVKASQVRDMIGSLEDHSTNLFASLSVLSDRVGFVSRPPLHSESEAHNVKMDRDGIPICDQLQDIMNSILKSEEVVEDILKRLEI